jgi:hypothetical protein
MEVVFILAGNRIPRKKAVQVGRESNPLLDVPQPARVAHFGATHKRVATRGKNERLACKLLKILNAGETRRTSNDTLSRWPVYFFSLTSRAWLGRIAAASSRKYLPFSKGSSE